MEYQNEKEIDLLDLFCYLKKKILRIGVVVALCALMGFAICVFFVSPTYTASTRMYVLNRSNQNHMVYSDFQVSTQILNDYKVLITGKNVTKQVIKKLGLNLTIEELEEKISVTAPDDTRVLQVSVSDGNARLAADIANCVREIASSQIEEIMDVDAVKLVYEAEAPEKPAAPSVQKYVLLGAVLGAITTIGLYTLTYILDDTVRTQEDIEQYFGLRVLAVIPVCAQISRRNLEGNTKPRKTARSNKY